MSGPERQRLNQLDALRGMAAMTVARVQARCRLGFMHACLMGRHLLPDPPASRAHLLSLNAPPSTTRLDGRLGLRHRPVLVLVLSNFRSRRIEWPTKGWIWVL